MRIFYSIDHSAIVYEALTGCRGAVNPYTGYGHASDELATHLEKLGVTIIRDVNEAETCDLELYFGQPKYKPQPTIHPSVMITMVEFEGVPTDWMDGLLSYDYIVTPSHWCQKVLSRASGRKDIEVLPLGFNPGKFPPMFRPDRESWTYLWVGDSLLGRKGYRYVMEAFQSLDLPDTRLILKMLPVKDVQRQATFVIPSVGQKWRDIVFLYERYSWDEMRQLLWEADVSVYPSEGEGFGLIPLEHMATGLCCVFTNYSGLEEMANVEFNIPIGWGRKKCSYAPGTDALPDMDELRAAMLWTYEHRAETQEKGRKAALWVREHWTWDQVAALYHKRLLEVLS